MTNYIYTYYFMEINKVSCPILFSMWHFVLYDVLYYILCCITLYVVLHYVLCCIMCFTILCGVLFYVSQVVEFCCSNCTAPVCRECVVSEHVGHNILRIGETADQFKRVIPSIIQDLKSKGACINNVITQVNSLKIFNNCIQRTTWFGEIFKRMRSAFYIILHNGCYITVAL